MARGKKPPRHRRNPTSIQTDDLPELKQARMLWQQNRRLQALALFQRIAKRHPSNVRAVADASRALGAFYRVADAESLLAPIASQLQADSKQVPIEALHLVAQSYRIIRRPNQAIKLFRTARQLDPKHEETRLELALLLERQGSVDEARRLLSQRSGQRHSAESQMLLGRTLRRSGQFELAESALHDVARSAKTFWMTRKRAWCELALLHDQQHEFDQAWDAIQQSQAMGRQHRRAAREHRNRIVPKLVELIEQLDQDTLLRWSERQLESNTELLLLSGLPRSGTTLVAQELHRAPGLVACDELDAFPGYVLPALLDQAGLSGLNVEHLDAVDATRLDSLAQHYFRSLAEACSTDCAARWLIDKNPSLLMLFPIYLRVVSIAHLVVVTRDVRDVLISSLLTYFPLNDYSVDFLELETAVERIALEARMWERLSKRLPPRWRCVAYEQWVEDPARNRDETLRWIGTQAPDAQALPGSEPVTVPDSMWINSPSYDSVQNPIHRQSIGRWRNYEQKLKPVIRSLNDTNAIFARFLCDR